MIDREADIAAMLPVVVTVRHESIRGGEWVASGRRRCRNAPRWRMSCWGWTWREYVPAFREQKVWFKEFLLMKEEKNVKVGWKM